MRDPEMPQPKNLTIPLKLDAFVLNEQVSSGGEKDSRIAPITQPNYTFLQLADGLIQHDILDHVDLHNATPATANSRLYDLGQGTLRKNRVGVYLHWTVPRFYRTGSAATQSGTEKHTENRRAKGISTSDSSEPDYASPQFRSLPNRWLVIRTVDPNAPTTEPKGTDIKPVDAWIVESDRLRSIDDADLDDADLQIDISPYITTNKQSVNNIKLDKQAETFIGLKQSAESWTRDQDKDKVEQRVDLTAVSSSNQLFLDYQPHCSNVFSVVDTFAYGDGKHLQKAVANYYVIGWHADAVQGPFGDLVPTGKITRQDRLAALSMALSGKDKGLPDDIQKWLESPNPAQVLCHGAMYSVAWDDSKWPDTVPANKASQTLLDAMPVTVGTTPIDSLLAYIDSHQHNEGETDEELRLEKDLHLLGPLLRAQDEGVDAHRVAVDEVQNWNFARESGGKHWHLQSQEGKPPAIPSKVQADAIEDLNHAQRVLDGANREIVQLQWTMFSYWWRFVSSVDRKVPFRVDKLEERIERLREIKKDQEGRIEKVLQNKEAFPTRPQEGVLSEFNQPRDPTLLVAGIRAGWPDDFLDDLRVRVDTQLVMPEKKVDLTPYSIGKLPDDLQDTAAALVQEFIALSNDGVKVPADDPRLPLYHDHGNHGDPSGPRRDQWGDTQPWAPLILEWQAEYFHIPWRDWAMTGERKDQLDMNWRLGIRPDTDLQSQNITDRRPLSGRILLLPQPNFSLQTAIDQLFNSVDPEVLKRILDEDQQKEVKSMTWKLPFLSAPLDGFTDHLLTLVHGTHIKPNVRYPVAEGYPKDKSLQPIADAVVEPFKPKHLQIIDIHSELTPYGALLTQSTDSDGESTTLEGKKPHPFKPVTHGQFRFSKLNIIDKFGQAISAIDPRYGHDQDQAVFPHLSAYYEPQLFKGKANLVRKPRQGCEGHCEFAQVPPAINQPARLNSTFVKHDDSPHPDPNDSYWRPITEWENPIWGWIVLNYVDNGIQIFLQDGTFYREVRLASPDAPQHTSKSVAWLPYTPPHDRPNTDQLDQLDHLIAKLTEPNQKYLHDFLRMANEFLTTASPAPSAYAGFLNSLVGRPLALVNAGWSLELATEEKTVQADLDTNTETRPPTKLTGDPNIDDLYEFPVKVGDKDRASDGIVGYFHLKDTKDKIQAGDELDLDTIYTYYSSGSDPKDTNLKQISTDDLLTLQSFWLDPGEYEKDDTIPAEDAAKAFTQDWNKKLTVYGCIMDPFLPITSYSSVLPMNNLRLSSWVWQEAMQKMTAFFHLGPIVVTEDVEKYRKEGKALSGDYRLDTAEQEYPTLKEQAVEMPSLQTGNWAWLQPYAVESKDAQEEYKPLGLRKVDARPKFQQGPYTALEGYLQLRAPIVRDQDQK